MVNELQNERADIGNSIKVLKHKIGNKIISFGIAAVTDFTVTRERSDVITFAQPITQIYHSLFIKNPEGTFNFKSYVDPLKYSSWIFVGLFCLFCPPFLYLSSQ